MTVGGVVARLASEQTVKQMKRAGALRMRANIVPTWLGTSAFSTFNFRLTVADEVVFRRQNIGQFVGIHSPVENTVRYPLSVCRLPAFNN